MNADAFVLPPRPKGEEIVRTTTAAPPPIPSYLHQHYWWAYVHPSAPKVFERPWLVDLILWGNYRRLIDAAMAALGQKLPGRSLQIACVYGELTRLLSQRIAQSGGTLDVLDILPVQLANLRAKLPADAPVSLLQQDSSAMDIPDATYDRVLLFFLLHEQPADVRRATLAEAQRVVKPGGQIVIVDFSRPKAWHPLRYLWLPVLTVLEPFAPDLWRNDERICLPPAEGTRSVKRRTYFGGMYQLIDLIRA